jgi:hypothetical protein
MELHEKMRLSARCFELEKVTNAQAKSAVPMMKSAADRLEVLEREHAAFFERWNQERKRREDLELALSALVDRDFTYIGEHAEISYDDIKAARRVLRGKTLGTNAK